MLVIISLSIISWVIMSEYPEFVPEESIAAVEATFSPPVPGSVVAVAVPTANEELLVGTTLFPVVVVLALAVCTVLIKATPWEGWNSHICCKLFKALDRWKLVDNSLLWTILATVGDW